MSYTINTFPRNKQHLQHQAEELKQELWSLLDKYKITHEGVKESMNELLDLIDELEQA